MPLSLINWLLAFSPILILVFLMAGLSMRGSKAGVITWFIAQIIAFLFFGANINILGYANLKSLFLALDVLLIIWGAMYLYQVTRSAGTIQKIGQFLSSFTSNKAYLGLFLGWLFPSFLQGMGGFGVPVAVSAPLLMSAGFSPLNAIILTSIGHGWGVSFGSMGTSIRTLEAVTGLPFRIYAPQSAILLGIAAMISGLIVVYTASERKQFLKSIPLTLLAALILCLGQYFLAKSDLWVLAVTLPSLAALIVVLLLVGTLSKASREWIQKLDRRKWKGILYSIAPYGLLVLLILAFNFIFPVREFVKPFSFSLQFPAMKTAFGFNTPSESGKAINLFLHPGTILFITGGLSYTFFKHAGLLQRNQRGEILKDTLKSSLNTSIAILSLVATAVVMRHAGMISLLAQGISSTVPIEIYPVVSPFIGALGAFITGSNNNSNVLFAPLQLQTAELLGLPAVWILAAQTTGGALGSIMAPAKVILGCNTVGIDGKEGQVISRLILTCLGIILIVGLFAFWFTR